MYFKVYRDCDTLRLRKVVVELWDADPDTSVEYKGQTVEINYHPNLIDRTRMFACPLLWLLPWPILFLFPWRLQKRKEQMLKCAADMLAAQGNVPGTTNAPLKYANKPESTKCPNC